MDIQIANDLKILSEKHPDYVIDPSQPHELDALIVRIIRFFIESDEVDRTGIINSIAQSLSASKNLLCFSDRMATQSVRIHAPETLFYSLMAHVLENRAWDWRENALILSLVCHSAKKLNIPISNLFRRAAQFAFKETREVLESYAKSGGQTIAEMGFQEISEPFGYKRIW